MRRIAKIATYKFVKPLRTYTTPSKYFNAFCYLYVNGPSTKRTIMKNALGKDPQTCVYEFVNRYGQHIREDVTRGWYSKMFAAAHHKGILDYNKHTRMWALSEMGRRYVEKVIDSIK